MRTIGDAIEQLTGFPPGHYEGTLLTDGIAPVDADFVSLVLRQVLQGGHPPFEFQMLSRDMSPVWLRMTATVTTGDDGRQVVAGMLLDVTPERLTWRSRELVQRQYKRILYRNPAPIVFVDRNGGITYANPAAERVLGLNRSVIKGRTYDDPQWHITDFDGGSFPAGLLPFQRVKATGESVEGIRHAIRWPDGRTVYLSIDAVPIYDEHDEFDGIIAMTLDLTGEVMAQRKLRRNNVILQSIIHSLPGAVAVIDRDYRILHTNLSNFRLAGGRRLKREELEGRWCYEVFMDRDSPCPWCRIQQVMETGETVEEITAPGDPREVLTGRALKLFIAPIADEESGEVFGIVEYGTDVTDLREAWKKAEAASQSKTRFLANMSHEVRTPMSGVMGMLQLVRDTELDESQREYIDLALQSSGRMIKLLGDILDLARIEADSVPFLEERVNPGEVVRSVCDLFQPTAQRKGIALDCRMDESVPSAVTTDGTRLSQVLSNLIGNAMKFTDEGSVRLHAEAWEADAATCTLRFTITDTGIGIPASKLESIREPFVVGDDQPSSGREGAGLGLAMVQELLDHMGGSFDLQSQEGKGTTVTVALSLPLAGEAREGAGPEPGPAPAPPGEERAPAVLLAEDDAVNRIAVRRMLEKEGCTVTTAENGRKALEMVEQQRFDCVFMDIKMPVMDGLQALRELRDHERYAHTADVPVIALTAYTMEGDDARFLDEGMDGYLAKPVSRDALREMLDRHCASQSRQRPV